MKGTFTAQLLCANPYFPDRAAFFTAVRAAGFAEQMEFDPKAQRLHATGTNAAALHTRLLLLASAPRPFVKHIYEYAVSEVVVFKKFDV